MTAPTHEAPYRGLRVLDLGQGVASPCCGYLPAGSGADVIKVEPPRATGPGAWARRMAVGTTVFDIVIGLDAFQAVATTLFARQTTGRGRRLDISLTQSTAALLGHKLAEHMLEGGAPRALNAPAGSYPTRDGWIMVTLASEAQHPACARRSAGEACPRTRVSPISGLAPTRPTTLRPRCARPPPPPRPRTGSPDCMPPT